MSVRKALILVALSFTISVLTTGIVIFEFEPRLSEVIKENESLLLRNRVLKMEKESLRKLLFHERILRASEEHSKRIIIAAIIHQESNGDPKAFNKKEQAVGILQIRPIMVEEVNRLIKNNKYSLSDRWNEDKSLAMFIDYNNIVNPNWDPEQAARKWNGGINGMSKPTTLEYWLKLEKNINELKNL